MKSTKHCFAKLLSLTQLFLMREYSLKEIKIVDPTIFAFFQNKMKSLPVLPATKKVPLPPLTAIQIPKTSLSNSTIPHPAEPRPEPPPPSKPLPPPTQPEPLFPDPIPPPVKLTTCGVNSGASSAQDRYEPHRDLAQLECSNLSTSGQLDRGEYKSKSKGFILEPLIAPPAKDLREFWKLCSTLFPGWTLCETIPSDAIAQKHKNAWLNNQMMTPVIILAFHDEEKQFAFLKNIAKAISLCLAPACVVSAQRWEKENDWENILNSSHLRLIIACDYGLYLQPKLMRFYREAPQQNKHFLNQIPLLLLSDLSLYLKEPQLKPLLWRAICNEFAASQQHYGS
jgi:hypothetical protein